MPADPLPDAAATASSDRATFASDLLACDWDERSDVIRFGVDRGWSTEVVAGVMAEPALVHLALPELAQRHRGRIYRWAAGRGIADATMVASAAIAVGDAADAVAVVGKRMPILLASPSSTSDITNALHEDVRRGRTDAAIGFCRVGLSLFPLVDAPTGFADAQRAWMTDLFAAPLPVLAVRRRRLLLLRQAAADAGVMVIHDAMDGHAPPTCSSIRPPATIGRFMSPTPSPAGMQPDAESLLWVLRLAIQHGVLHRDRQFARYANAIAAHLAATGTLAALAALGATAGRSP